MIKKLRFKFILISLISIFIVLSSTIAGINIHNFYKVEGNAQTTLNLIIERGNDHPHPDEDIPPEPKTKSGEFGPHQLDRPKDDNLMSEHYYLVTFNSDGSVKEYDFRHIFTVNEEDGLEFAKSIYASSLKEGKSGEYRFLKQEKDGLTYVAVLDLKTKLDEARSFLISSLIIASIGYVVIGVLIIFASFIVYKPTEESYKKQKQFITNASHELKTPLTIISTDLELIEMDNGKSEWTSSIKDQVLRLTKMTNQLVTLSKIDEGDMKTFPKEEFSLSEVAIQCLDTFSPLFAEANLNFKYDVERDIKFEGNKAAIDELFHVFLENALKYAKENGKVSAAIKKEKSHIVITFKNDVKDPSKIDTNQLFDRFYRGSDVTKSGSGIGLSIAKEIIRLHKGNIKAVIVDNQLVFEIIF